jgi:hypothetical protein
MAMAKPLYVARMRRARAAWVFDLRPEMFILATIVVIALTSLLYLTQASNVAATGYDITYARDERAKLERELQGLNGELARLQALGSIETDATSKLGMVPAPIPEYVQARALPVDVEAAVARAEREAEHRPLGWRAQLAALLRLSPVDTAPKPA